MKYNKVFDTERQCLIDIEQIKQNNTDLWSHRHSPGRFLSESQDIILSFVDEIPERHYKKSGTTGKVQAHFRKNPCSINKRQELIDKVNKYEESIHDYVSKLFTDKVIKSFNVVTPIVDCLGEYREIYSDNNVEIVDIIGEDEAIFDDSKYRPDVYTVASINGVLQNLVIEIKYSHEIGDEKLNYYKSKGINCIEIDISSIKGVIRIENRTDKITKEMDKYLKDIIISNKYNNNYWLNNIWEDLLNLFIDTYCKRITYSPYSMGNGYLCDSTKFQRTNPEKEHYWPEKSIMAILYHKDTINNKNYPNYIEVDWQNTHGVTSIDYDKLVCEKCTDRDRNELKNPFYEHLIYAEINKSDMTKSVFYINTTDVYNGILHKLHKQSILDFFNSILRTIIAKKYIEYNTFGKIVYTE